MKVVLLVTLVGVICVALFVTGLLSPSRSRRLQSRTDSVAGRVQDKGERKAGRMGDMFGSALRKSRKATGRSAEKGRELHERLGPEDR